MSAPAIIQELVEKFAQHNHEYQHRKNETELRREFLDPMLEALGWDVTNRKSNAEKYKEVIHEQSIEIEGRAKAADYAFRMGDKTIFLLEAKKPSVKIETNPAPAFQVRRYGWSLKVPISLLSDFEQLAVYDCRVGKPDMLDGPSKGRLKLYHYSQYVEKWDEIAAIFSRDAVLAGAFDQFAEAQKSKKGTTEVDEAFLQEIEGWRKELARNIALRNQQLIRNERDLNYAVQMTIDRIIFLRICEDRSIEPDEQLREISGYSDLLTLFKRADMRYNSGLFHLTGDRLTLDLQIDDAVLKKILESLYYPHSPYAFNYISADILGQVYEQFLGKVIKLTAGHQAEVQEKPEVRKAGGVYYTPRYIVDYIVKNTVGKLLDPSPDATAPSREGRTPKEAAKLKILDPACGSGSFLLGAYQFLLDWHLNWYIAHNPEKHAKNSRPPIFQDAKGEWKLTTDEKKRILLDNIYGVDIDAQAVEVTKLSLLLKVLEGESGQLGLGLERALPDLGNNIQCGNSLIGPDYYDDRQMPMFGSEESYRVNVFDWHKAFPAIFAAGGFDAVIGNPPYIRIHNLVDYYPDEVRFIQSHYSTASFGKVDIFVAFVEKAISVLTKIGLLGFIIPNKFMQADYGVGLRNFITERKLLTQLVDFGNAQVFNGATTYTCLLFLSNFPQTKFQAKFNKSYAISEHFLREADFEERNVKSFASAPWQIASSTDAALLDKLENIPTRLSSIIELAITGVKTGANSIFIFEVIELGKDTAKLRPEDTEDEVELETKYLVPYLKAESLKRYRIRSGSRVLLYPYEAINNQTRLVPETQIKDYPKTWTYLNKFKTELEGRQKGKLKGPSWYGLSFSSSLQMFSVPKIITPTLSPQNAFSLDMTGNFFPQGAGGGCGLVPKDSTSPYYLLSLLNSQLLTFFFQRISSPFQGGWFAYEPRYLNRIPIYIPNFSSPTEKAAHDRLVSLVETMLALHKQLPSARTPQETTMLTRQIEATDSQIDKLVYGLYGLTEEEIRIVEGK